MVADAAWSDEATEGGRRRQGVRGRAASAGDDSAHLRAQVATGEISASDPNGDPHHKAGAVPSACPELSRHLADRCASPTVAIQRQRQKGDRHVGGERNHVPPTGLQAGAKAGATRRVEHDPPRAQNPTASLRMPVHALLASLGHRRLTTCHRTRAGRTRRHSSRHATDQRPARA